MAPGSNNKVYPSGSDFATYSVPMLLPAPGLFSMNTCWPHIAESLSASMRGTMSVGPPAATGTVMAPGLPGVAGLGRLRACREGPRTRRAADERDEVAPLHSEHGDVLPCQDGSAYRWRGMPNCDCAGDIAGAQRRANIRDLVTTAIAR